jgi:C1A family cysteine protease
MLYCDTIIECPVNMRGKNYRALAKLKRRAQAKEIQLNMKYPLGYIRDPDDERDYKFRVMLKESPIKVASKIDWEPELSPVKDQGQLGSCVGFAVTALKEWQEKVEHEAELAEGKKGKSKVYDLSESWLYWNCKKIDAWPGEEGTSIRYAMKVLQQIGVPVESAWPYDDVVIGEPEGWANLVARWNTIESYWRVDNLTQLKAALNSGPVPIGIACFLEIFYTGSDGMIPYPKDPQTIYGGHAVLACGYQDSKKLIKFKNSWGTGWGKNGYGFIPYDYIKEFMWDAWAAKDHAVTNEMLKGKRELI